MVIRDNKGRIIPNRRTSPRVRREKRRPQRLEGGKPLVRETDKRSPKIDRYFKSKTRFNDRQVFLELKARVKFKGEQAVTTYGYATDFNASSDAELNRAINRARLNAIIKAYYESGLKLQDYEEVDQIDDEDLEAFEVLDFNFYYLNFKNTQTRSYTNKKGNKIVIFRSRGKIEGGGKEIPEQQAEQEFENIYKVAVGSKDSPFQEFR